MIIIQLNTTYGDSDSSGRNVKELHDFFLKEGIDSRVYVTQSKDIDDMLPLGVHLFSGWFDMKWHAIMSRITGLQGYYSLASTMKLIKKINADKPDAIILNVLHSNCVNFEKLFRYIAEKNIALIVVLHDCFFYTGHCCHYVGDGCCRWEEECGNCPSMRKWNASWFFDTSKKSLHDKDSWYKRINKKGVVAVSRWLEEDVRRSILRESQITTIYNWIDFDIFHPERKEPLALKGIEDKTLALAVASYWGADKGLAEIFEVAKAIPEIIIFMVGHAPSIPQNITNIVPIGVVKDSKELAGYYANVDVYLNPSKQETFGKTIAESLSCGTPVVVYDTTACRELVDSTRGEVAKLNDIKDYIAKTRIVIQNGKGHYHEKAVQFAHDFFDRDTNLKKYIWFINELLNE